MVGELVMPVETERDEADRLASLLVALERRRRIEEANFDALSAIAKRAGELLDATAETLGAAEELLCRYMVAGEEWTLPNGAILARDPLAVEGVASITITLPGEAS